MKTLRFVALCYLLVIYSLVLFACCERINEQESISQLKKNANKMTVKELRTMVLKYKKVLEAKGPVIREIFEHKLDIQEGEPFTPKIAEKIAAYISTPEGRELESYFKDLERYALYYFNLKEKGGDLSDLEIEISPYRNEGLYDIRPYRPRT